MRYLVDTPALLDLVAGDRAAAELARHLLAEDADFVTSSIAAAEAAVLAGPAHAAALGRLLAALDIEPLGGDAAADAAGFVLRARSPLPLSDALVAAHARILGAAVITRDRPALASAGADVVGY